MFAPGGLVGACVRCRRVHAEVSPKGTVAATQGHCEIRRESGTTTHNSNNTYKHGHISQTATHATALASTNRPTYSSVTVPLRTMSAATSENEFKSRQLDDQKEASHHTKPGTLGEKIGGRNDTR